MSQRDDAITLQQMLDHAREAIELSQKQVAHGTQEARILELALIRLLEVLGEAANRVSEETRLRHQRCHGAKLSVFVID